MNEKKMGEYIAELRRSAGMTQKELALKLNVSDKAVSRWERGDSLPDLYMAADIADLFGITVDELLHCGRKTEAHDSSPSDPIRNDGEKRRMHDENIERALRVNGCTYNVRSNIVCAMSVIAFMLAIFVAHGLDGPGIDGWALAFGSAAITDAALIVYQISLAVKFYNYIGNRLVSESKSAKEKIAECREKLTKKAMLSVGFVITIFVLTVVYLHLGDWLEFLLCGLIFAPLTALGCTIASLIVWSVLNKRGKLS